MPGKPELEMRLSPKAQLVVFSGMRALQESSEPPPCPGGKIVFIRAALVIQVCLSVSKSCLNLVRRITCKEKGKMIHKVEEGQGVSQSFSGSAGAFFRFPNAFSSKDMQIRCLG